MLNLKFIIDEDCPTEAPVSVRLGKTINGDVHVIFTNANGETRTPIRFNKDGTFTRLRGPSQNMFVIENNKIKET